ncbi:hypothetical protein PENTCL1PPCAC_30404, partial [Pristionchus entomophagus]
ALQGALKRSTVQEMNNNNEIPKSIVSVGEHVNNLVDNLQYIEFRHQLLRRSDFSPRPNNPQSIMDVLKRSTAMGQPQKEMLGWPMTQSNNQALLSLEDHVRLRIPMPRLHIDRIPNFCKFWIYADHVYAIEWAKTLEFFRLLELGDQVHSEMIDLPRF